MEKWWCWMVSAKIVGNRVARIGKPDVDVERVSTRLELAKGCKFGKSGRFMMLPLAPVSRDVEKTPCGCVSPQGCRVEQKQTQGVLDEQDALGGTTLLSADGGRQRAKQRQIKTEVAHKHTDTLTCRGRAWIAVYRSCQISSYLPEVLVKSSRFLDRQTDTDAYLGHARQQRRSKETDCTRREIRLSRSQNCQAIQSCQRCILAWRRAKKKRHRHRHKHQGRRCSASGG